MSTLQLQPCTEYCQQIDGSKPGVTGSGEGVLANFFNSLLHKKTGTGTPAPKMSGDDCGIIKNFI